MYYLQSQIPAFDGIQDDFMENTFEFKEIYDSSSPQSAPLPGKWNTKLSTFQKLLILRCVRPDKVVLGIQVSRA